MPSFTLLGPQVIRFPFILHSSYPHEILHNWWGNGVFVDYEKGNWCEGLTAYLADHLVQEQRGAGDEYRRSTLQKYRDYVQEGRDFPLTEFRERHSAATEAVGYGKALMMDHMLRRRIGDDAFRKGLAAFYRKHSRPARQIRRPAAAFEGASETELGEFFQQWTTRTGAPVLSVDNVQVQKSDAGFVVSGLLKQTQDADPYALDVPVTVLTDWRASDVGRAAQCARTDVLRHRRRSHPCRCTSTRCSTCFACWIRVRHRRRSDRSSVNRRSWPCCLRRPQRNVRRSTAS